MGFSAGIGYPYDNDLAYFYCKDESGYCLSLTRYPNDGLVKVMVVDQRVRGTMEVAVELSRDQLRVSLSPAVAAELDGITEYVVPLVGEFALSEEELRELDAVLSVIFEGGHRGRYDRILTRPESGAS